MSPMFVVTIARRVSLMSRARVSVFVQDLLARVAGTPEPVRFSPARITVFTTHGERIHRIKSAPRDEETVL